MRQLTDAYLRELITNSDSELYDAFCNIFRYKKLSENAQDWKHNTKEFYKFCYKECCKDLPLSADECESERVKKIFNDVFIEIGVCAMANKTQIKQSLKKQR